MADYAYLDEDHRQRDDRITADEAKLRYNKKGSVFLCACGIRLHLCYGEILTEPYFAPIDKNEKHRLINGHECPCKDISSINVGITKYGLKSLFYDDKREPTSNEIAEIDAIINKEREPSTLKEKEENIPKNEDYNSELDELFAPVNDLDKPVNEGEPAQADSSKDDSTGSVSGSDINEEFKSVNVVEREKVSYSLPALYEEVKGGEKNKYIHIYRGDTVSAYDLVVNKATILSHLKAEGIGPGRKLVHCYKTVAPKELGYQENTLIFRDDTSEQPTCFYFEVYFANDIWYRKYREMVTTPLKKHSLHFYIYGEWTDVSRNGYTVYRCSATFKTFKFSCKTKKEYQY